MLERAARIRVEDPSHPGRYAFGSGFLLAAGRILTAAHVLVGPDRPPPARPGDGCAVFWAPETPDWVPGEVLWVDPVADLAVVGVAIGLALEAVRWGRLEGDEPVRWNAAGYPRASLNPTGREAEHAYGTVSAVTQAGAGLLGLTIESREAEDAEGGSGWSGLSGAAVVCQDRLVGVVTVDPSGYRRSLVAQRISVVAGDVELARVLGAPPVVDAVSAEGARRAQPGRRRVPVPAETTDLIGREAELAQAEAALADTRLLTITGVGGVGKTRLARELARKMEPAYAGGACYAALAPVAEGVAQAVASAAGVAEQPGRSLIASLTDELDERPVLLVLDNCEHLVDEVRDVAGQVLDGCPDVRIVATSRQPLELGGETVLSLAPLPVPGAGAELDTLRSVDSVRLFEERARKQDSTFALDARNAVAVADICRWLEGIPLAVELVVARLRAFPVQELAGRLADWFAAGADTAGGAPHDRQRTMYAAVDWSYRLLSPDEQAVLRRLAVFAGGWTLDAAEQVAGGDLRSGAIFDLLARLVDKSLVARRPARFRLLEPVREYARERLDASTEGAGVRARHAAWVCGLVAGVAPSLRVADQPALDLIEADENNIREALRFLLAAGTAGDGLRLATRLGPYWFHRARFSEGRSWFETALTAATDGPEADRVAALVEYAELVLPSDAQTALGAAEEAVEAGRRLADPALLASTLRTVAHTEMGVGRWERATAHYEECVGAAHEAGDAALEAVALSGMADAMVSRGDIRGAISIQEGALSAMRHTGDAWETTNATALLGLWRNYAGDFEQGTALLRDALARFEAVGSAWGVGWVHCALAEPALAEGRVDEAEREYRAGLAAFDPGGMDELVAWAYSGLGHVALVRGDVAEARDRFTAMVAVRRRVQGPDVAPDGFVPQLAALFAAEGRHELAARLLGGWAGAVERGSVPTLYGKDRQAHDRSVASARAALGDDAFARAWGSGLATPIDALAGEAAAAFTDSRR